MKSGFVSLIGKPNVGKSTIMNLLSNRKVSIVTPKAQTTRNNIISVVDAPEYQIVFTDTPGYHDAKNALGISMNKKVNEAMHSADVLILVLSAKEEISEKYLAPFLSKSVRIVVLNKIDLIRLPEANLAKSRIKDLFPKATLIEMCATDGFNADALLKATVKLLKDGPKYYPDARDATNEVFDTKEIIREQILYALKDEVPHHIAIYIKSIKKQKERALIEAEIIVNKDSQKGIVIGHGGKTLKLIGTKARQELEKYFKRSIYLDLHVKVKKDWINSPRQLKELGY